MSKKSALLLALHSLFFAVSIVVNIVVINADQTKQIMDCTQIGLYPLINGDISEMFVDEGNNPDLHLIVNDLEIIKKAIDILDSGCYQKCPPISYNSAPGSNTFPFIMFKADDHTYVVEILADRVCVLIDDEEQFYYTNIQNRMKQLIYSVVLQNT